MSHSRQINIHVFYVKTDDSQYYGDFLFARSMHCNQLLVFSTKQFALFDAHNHNVVLSSQFDSSVLVSLLSVSNV